jgi:hypothetical protein
MLFSLTAAIGSGGGSAALANALPSSGERGVVVLNVPSALQIYYQHLMRARRNLPELPFIDVLYAGAQPVELQRSGERSLEVEVARGSRLDVRALRAQPRETAVSQRRRRAAAADACDRARSEW